MKSKITKIKTLLVATVSIYISACGGGGSDSGGAQNNVTSCITTETRTNSLDLTETTLTNTCDFTVTLGRGVVSIGTIVNLEPGESDTTILVGDFIACRPPSQPFDRDDTTGTNFACIS